MPTPSRSGTPALCATLLALTALQLTACPETLQVADRPLHEGHDYDPDPTAPIWSEPTRVALARKDCADHTLLHLAAWRGDLPIAERLLSAGLSPSATNARGDTPLHLAAHAGHLPLVARLTPLYDRAPRDLRGRTPLHHAAQMGHLPIVRHLHGWASLADDGGLLPVHLAARHDHPELVTALAATTPIELPDGRARTPLHHAASRGAGATVVRLLELGASPASVDAEGLTPLHLAAASAWPSTFASAEPPATHVVELLLEGGADPMALDADQLGPLHHAARAGNLAALRALLVATTSASTPSPRPPRPDLLASALALAIAHAHPDLAEALVLAGADPGPHLSALLAAPAPFLALLTSARATFLANTATKSGAGLGALDPNEAADAPSRDAIVSAFERALLTASAEHIAVLLDAGLDPNDPSLPSGAPPLHLAIAASRLDTAAVLLARGARPDAPSSAHGAATALHLAVTANDPAAIALLAVFGASPLVVDAENRTPADLTLAPTPDAAARAARADTLAALLRYFALPRAPGSTFRLAPTLSPAKLALATHAHADLIALLLPPDDLDWAIARGDLPRVRALLAPARAPTAAARAALTGLVDRRGPDGQAPLHRAIAQGHVAIAAHLLELGASPDLAATPSAIPALYAGWTPAHFAMWRLDPPLVALLKQRGASFDLPDAAGRTPAALLLSLDLQALTTPHTLTEILAHLPGLEGLGGQGYGQGGGGRGGPLRDTDGDGILDIFDQCPHEPETYNGFEDEDGCPDARPHVIIAAPSPREDSQAPAPSLRLDTGPGSELLFVVDRDPSQDLVFDESTPPTPLASLRACAAAEAWPELERLASLAVGDATTPGDALLVRHTLARARLGQGLHAEAYRELTAIADALQLALAQLASRLALAPSPIADALSSARRQLADRTARVEESRAYALELTGRPLEALSRLEHAAATLGLLGSSPHSAENLRLSWLSAHKTRLLTQLGRYAAALDEARLTHALRRRAAGPDSPLTRVSAANLGVLHGLIGDETTARTFAERHLAQLLRLLRPDPSSEAPPSAANPDDRAPREAPPVALLTELSTARHNLARFLIADGEAAAALALIDEAFEPPPPWGPGAAPSGLLAARLHRAAGDAHLPSSRPLAHAAYRRALEALETSFGPTHPELARVLLDLADTSPPESVNDVREILARAWSIASRADSPELRWRVELALGRYLSRAPHLRPAAAIHFGKRAVETLELLRSNVAPLGPDLERLYLERRVEAYRELAALLIDAGRFLEAHEVLDRLRLDEARTVVLRHAPAVAPLTPTPAEREATVRLEARSTAVGALAAELAILERQQTRAALPPATATRKATIVAALDQSRVDFLRELDLVAEELEAENQAAVTPDARTEVADRIHETGVARTLMTAQTQELLDALPGSPVLVHYLLGQTHLRVFVTSPDTQVARRIPYDASALTQLVFAFRLALTDPGSDPLPIARELHAQLIAPITPELSAARATTLMLALDGPLRYLPFAALHDGERYLVERFRLAIATPVAQAALVTPPAPTWSVAAFGVALEHPGYAALPAVPPELEAIVKRAPDDPDGVLPGRLLLDRAFTRDALTAQLGAADHRVLHIASHFTFAPFDPKTSHLLLGDGDRLDLATIQASLRFRRVDLLTLSACNTAVGDATSEERRAGRRRGREIEGLAQVAIENGARAVLATLWPVADTSTAELMRRFYALRSASSTKADALRLAQLALLRGAEPAPSDQPAGLSPLPPTVPAASAQASHAHPFYWAPFILIGNWL